MAKFLTEQGWKAHYFNKDVDLPSTANSGPEHYWGYHVAKTQKYYSTHRVPLSGWIVNYKKEYNKTRTEWRWIGTPTPWFMPTPKIPIRVTVSNETRAAFDRFTGVKFAVLIAKQGWHTMMVAYGNTYEVHYDRERDNLYAMGRMYDMDWHSGIVVVPPDIGFDSDPIR